MGEAEDGLHALLQGDQRGKSHLSFLALSRDASGFLGNLKIPQIKQERQ